MNRMMPRVSGGRCAAGVRFVLAASCVFFCLGTVPSARVRAGRDGLRGGASAVDITPTRFPVIVNGGFLERKTAVVNDPLHARCLVLDDGATRVALAVVEVCVLPAELIERVKAEAARATGIPGARMMISATHTHSAPSCMGALGTPADPDYPAFLERKLAECIVRAAERVAPVRVGCAAVGAPEHTNCRRWIYRPDRMQLDPFGGRTVRANMHPGYQNPDTIGPAGPIDPGLTLLSVQARDGRPLAVFANYSMHYFGAPAISADYSGVFCREISRLVGGDEQFVAILSQGTAGDLHWMDYSAPKKAVTLPEYAAGLAGAAQRAHATVEHRASAPLAMAETTIRLRRRVPDAARLAWAQGVVAAMAGRARPKDRTEVYALEQMALAAEPERDVRLQAIRVGDLGIVAVSCEVFGITGLKLKAMSPLRPTFTIELANGEEGYIPPPAQHSLGGYTTWPARTAGLEVNAEPKIVDAALGLLERISGRPRRAHVVVNGPYARAVLASRPVAYWRMEEFEGPKAHDATGQGRAAAYTERVAFHLPGPDSTGFSGPHEMNRAPHFAGGRMECASCVQGPVFTVELWFWNGLPADARPVTGCVLSRGEDRLIIGGTGEAPGRLMFAGPGGAASAGRTVIAPKTWHHVALVRDGRTIRVHLDGNTHPEIECASAPGTGAGELLVGDDRSSASSFEGKLDEVAVYGRALAPAEIAAHEAAAGEIH